MDSEERSVGIADWRSLVGPFSPENLAALIAQPEGVYFGMALRVGHEQVVDHLIIDFLLGSGMLKYIDNALQGEINASR